MIHDKATVVNVGRCSGNRFAGLPVLQVHSGPQTFDGHFELELWKPQ